ncbi:MAG: chromate resistance protein ChrB domain-containing protein, partial [Sphingosinicella sp.]
MPLASAIPVDKLLRLVGTPACPRLIDLRDDAAFAELPRLIPGSIRVSGDALDRALPTLRESSAIFTCVHGGSLSAAAAAQLRAEGASAEKLEGGVAAWAEAGLPMVDPFVLPPRDAAGRTIWVTRARPKVDRIACPWLIRRFVDPGALFLFVAPAEVAGVAERLGAAPFDVEGVRWSHRGDLCTFDTMVEEFGLSGFPALLTLAEIVRGADTARPELAPQSAGLLAASLGLSRLYADDSA